MQIISKNNKHLIIFQLPHYNLPFKNLYYMLDPFSSIIEELSSLFLHHNIDKTTPNQHISIMLLRPAK